MTSRTPVITDFCLSTFCVSWKSDYGHQTISLNNTSDMTQHSSIQQCPAFRLWVGGICEFWVVIIITSIKVFIDCLYPSNIIVCMRHQVNIQHSRLSNIALLKKNLINIANKTVLSYPKELLTDQVFSNCIAKKNTSLTTIANYTVHSPKILTDFYSNQTF